MSAESSAKSPRSFLVVAGVGLVWNLLGISAYVSQVTMDPDALNALPEAERMLFENVPSWVTAAFAIAVNGGALGCLLLLFRKALAIPVLVASLLGVLVQMYHSFFIANSLEVYGPGGMIMPISILIIAAYLIWYAVDAKKKGWIS